VRGLRRRNFAYSREEKDAHYRQGVVQADQAAHTNLKRTEETDNGRKSVSGLIAARFRTKELKAAVLMYRGEGGGGRGGIHKTPASKEPYNRDAPAADTANRLVRRM
jgi:hypothetical protein